MHKGERSSEFFLLHTLSELELPLKNPRPATGYTGPKHTSVLPTATNC